MSVSTSHRSLLPRIPGEMRCLRIGVSLVLAVVLLAGLFLPSSRGQDRKDQTKPPTVKGSARIWVWVPADATLWFDGGRTTSTGRLRHFDSPPLEAGRQYRYTLQARWRGKGRTVTQTQKLRVSAGDEAVVTFPIPPGIDPEDKPLPPPVEKPALPRFHFTIDPATPLQDLLPVPPKVGQLSGPLLGDDLTHVPELRFQAPPTLNLAKTNAERAIAFQMAKINHLNNKKTDGFLNALLAARSDLQGLPFAMGDACRSKGEHSRHFALAVNLVRNRLFIAQQTVTVGGEVNEENASPQKRTAADVEKSFWQQLLAAYAEEDAAILRSDRVARDFIARGRVASLMQILAPESPALRLGLARYLATMSHIEATRALARLTLFSAEAEVRQAALDALKIRRERDYTDILLAGLRYPLPAVARRAADALVKLERSDLVPRLVALLDEPDPRAPVLEKVEQKQVLVVRELVRINHHQSCLLCHSPGNRGQAKGTLTASIPVPGEPLPSLTQYYNMPTDLLVRVDVTYLRQDFSLLQAVKNAKPWPKMQRFDFRVRKRVLTEEEAAGYRSKLAPRQGRLTPYQRAILAALRELTGHDTGPTGKDWRKLLEQSDPSRKAACAGPVHTGA
jgi:uncharacterized protein (TIGR03000 family)